MGPTWLQSLADRVALSLKGGVRVRVLALGPPPVAIVMGRTMAPPPEKLLRWVLELGPEAPGTVDVARAGNRWRIRVSGVGGGRFEQRPRNVLGNP